ncbi:POM 121 Nuclear envelope pore membrane protein [Triplophysa tibetana]|uniref:POM 121 Nuclear envelope pore membrane protein n=1 Tax=Triplophysa tibetana TaxID=1572043 RepID=A0A5A9N4I3_9TELE|nr:POM 121 Nuclear envelope pore membrane protein [Triplophysa tibetana]
MTRSKTFQAYLPDCHRTYSCIHCRAHLANHDELISKAHPSLDISRIVNGFLEKAVFFSREPRQGLPLQFSVNSSTAILPASRSTCERMNVHLWVVSASAASRTKKRVNQREGYFTQKWKFGHHLATFELLLKLCSVCSMERIIQVLNNLKSRKREVDEEDKFASGQKSKRRRNDSGGSSQSAFEPLLANGAPSQLVPKPGSLKRGMNSSVIEEFTMKRSRTSSISSVSGGPVPSGVPGSVRNPIRSSYSSSQGYPQRRAASSLSLSPFTSPGGSRCQTPERASKKAREDDVSSQSFTSFSKTNKETSDPAPATAKLTPKSETPVATSTSDSGGSGKRKRKIQLVTTNRGDQISLPPPPELGYTITVKDLDMEKKAAFTQIQKVLEEPEQESLAQTSQPVPAPTLTLFSNSSITSSFESAPAAKSAPSLVSLSKPLPETTPATSASPAPTIDLTITTPGAVSTAPLTLTSGLSVTSTLAAPTSSISNPLLESLKNMKNNPLLNSSSLLGSATTSAAPVVSATSLFIPAPSTNSGGVIKSESGPTVLQSLLSTPSSISTPALKPAPSMASAFAQILAQPLQPPPSYSSSLEGGSLFSLIKPVAAPGSQPPASTTAPPTAAVGPTISANSIINPLSSGFKPIFGAAIKTPASTPEVKPTQPTFQPLFGSTTQSGGVFGQTTASTMSTPAAPVTQTSSMLFGGLTGTQTPAVPVSSTASTQAPTQAPTQSLFGGWNTITTSAPTANATFQFGAPATTTAALSTTTASASSTTSAFQFGAAKPAPAPQTQSTFTFGQLTASQNSTSSPFGGLGLTTTTSKAPTTQTTFGSSTFTASAGSFAFGGAPSTAAPAFGTNSQSTFGVASSGFSFGNTTTPSAAPVFGASKQTAAPLPAPAPTFGFGGASTGTQNPPPSTPAPPSGGFNFGASMTGTPFGTPATAAQTPGFSFGANNMDNKPSFGTSTPTFGQGSAGMSIPFGSPGTPGFGAVGASSFGASPANFSIGTGSKPSGQRRLQARRQQRKK